MLKRGDIISGTEGLDTSRELSTHGKGDYPKPLISHGHKQQVDLLHYTSKLPSASSVNTHASGSQSSSSAARTYCGAAGSHPAGLGCAASQPVAAPTTWGAGGAAGSQPPAAAGMAGAAAGSQPPGTTAVGGAAHPHNTEQGGVRSPYMVPRPDQTSPNDNSGGHSSPSPSCCANRKSTVTNQC